MFINSCLCTLVRSVLRACNHMKMLQCNSRDIYCQVFNLVKCSVFLEDAQLIIGAGTGHPSLHVLSLSFSGSILIFLFIFGFLFLGIGLHFILSYQ